MSAPAPGSLRVSGAPGLPKHLSATSAAYLGPGDYDSDGEPVSFSQPRNYGDPNVLDESDLDTDADGSEG
jgi:hypothetical protein